VYFIIVQSSKKYDINENLIKVLKVKALFASFIILKQTIGRFCFIPWPNNRQHRVIADPFSKGAFIKKKNLFYFYFEVDNQISALSEDDGDWSSSLTSMKVVVVVHMYSSNPQADPPWKNRKKKTILFL